MIIVVDKDLCVGCGACAGACPVEAITIDDTPMATVDKDVCITCGTCVDTCPVGALQMMDETDAFVDEIADEFEEAV